MPKVIYTPTKGLYQATGTGFEISGAAIVPASSSLELAAPKYTITVGDPGSGWDTAYESVISIPSVDGATTHTISIASGGADVDSSTWVSRANAVSGIVAAIVALGTNEFAYVLSGANNEIITVYGLQAGEAPSGITIEGAGAVNITSADDSLGANTGLSGENNLVVVADTTSDIDATTLSNAGGPLTFASDALTGATLANGSAVGQKVSVMNLSTNRSITVTGLFFDCTGNSSETKLNLHASDIQQLIWNGSAWAEARSSGTPSFG